MNNISDLNTNGFCVSAKSTFVSKILNMNKTEYLFAYFIKIHNQTKKSAVLKKRYWKVTNGYGNIEIVQGDGVIGQQPKISSDEYYSYSSYCPLNTSFGFMEGYYEMEDESGGAFKIKIPNFQLIVPEIIN